MKKSIFTLAFLTLVNLLVFNLFTANGQDYPIARNDTIDIVFPLSAETTNLTDLILENDHWPDSISVNFFQAAIVGADSNSEDEIIINNETIEDELFVSDGIVEAGSYMLKNTEEPIPNTSHLDSAKAQVYFRIHNENHAYIDINNIKALINNFGSQFWDFEYSHFYAPATDSSQTVFTSGLWMGGMNQENLHLAAELYRYGPNLSATNAADFWAGPIANEYDAEYDSKWKHSIWKLDKTEVLNHINNWEEPGYEPIEAIASWPANGDIENGEAEKLAPFYDNEADGMYDPMMGDYPIIRGDQTIFFIMNDARGEHENTNGAAMDVEIHVMVYGYDKPNDHVLNNTVFFHYEIFNRSANNYTDTYFGTFTDLDIGWADDDYIRSNVDQGYYYGYNGDDVDGDGQPQAYGEYPPAQAVHFLAGPVLDADETDNPAYDGDCSIFDFSLEDGEADKGYAINGLNFGNGVADDERAGMTRFVSFGRMGANYQTDPDVAQDYYSYMKGLWRDGSSILYGGNGHSSAGAYGPEADFMYPGQTDPCNWGTEGQDPNGPVNWTEEEAGNAAGDRRGVAASGPFTFEAGSVEQLDIAYVYSRSIDPETSSSAKLMSDINILNTMAANNELELNNPGEVLGQEENNTNTGSAIKAHPNPADDILYISGISDDMKYKVVEMTGQTVLEGELNSDRINVSHLESGIYLLVIYNNESKVTKKISIK